MSFSSSSVPTLAFRRCLAGVVALSSTVALTAFAAPTLPAKPLKPAIADAAKKAPAGDCTTVIADRTATLGRDVRKTVSAEPGSYGHERECPNAFIADFVIDQDARNVPSTHGPQIHFEATDSRESTGVDFMVLRGVTSAECTAFRQTIATYRKGASDLAFRFAARDDLQGRWDGSRCILPRAAYGNIRAMPPAPGAREIWRVVLTTPGGAVGRVQAIAAHDPRATSGQRTDD